LQTKKIEQVVFIIMVAAVFVWVVLEARSFPSKAGLYPWAVGILGLVLAAVEIGLTITRKSKPMEGEPQFQGDDGGLMRGVRQAFPYMLWLGAYYVLIYLLGLVVASGLFIVAFLSLVGKLRWFVALGGAALLVLFLLGVSELLNLYWPDAFLLEWLAPVFDGGA
jgi:hypothetical protein